MRPCASEGCSAPDHARDDVLCAGWTFRLLCGSRGGSAEISTACRLRGRGLKFRGFRRRRLVERELEKEDDAGCLVRIGGKLLGILGSLWGV